jgi:hypothetical protein
MELMRRHQTSLVHPARARPCGECFLRIIFVMRAPHEQLIGRRRTFLTTRGLFL